MKDVGFRREHGRAPSEQEEKVLRAEVNRDVGPRAHLLAKKGAEAQGSPNFFTDEVLVYTAVANGLRTCRPTYILTKDEDVQEQFYKLMWLLDLHYRSMWFANAVAEEPGRFRILGMPMNEEEFARVFCVSDNLLLEKADFNLDDVLPTRSTFVDLHCCIIGDTYTEMIFGAEAEMAAVLDMKGATRGRSTDRFGARDCYGWLGPLDLPKEFRGCAGIAQSRTLRLPGSDAEISPLDAEQAIFSGERFMLLQGSESLLT